MEYRISGLYPAQSFFQLDVRQDRRAIVKILRDLRSDSLQLSSYQVHSY